MNFEIRIRQELFLKFFIREKVFTVRWGTSNISEYFALNSHAAETTNFVGHTDSVENISPR